METYDQRMPRPRFSSPRERSMAFASSLKATKPVFLAPMAGACPPALSAAVANTGGMGACGAVLLSPDTIADWAREFRHQSSGPFQINLWVPDPPPVRNPAVETEQRAFLGQWGPAVAAEDADRVLPDFYAQCRAVLEAKPTVTSSIMGLFPPAFVQELKARDIVWFATATTVLEAQAAEAAGADAIVVQGAEAGGHRGAFLAEAAESHAVGLFALLPRSATPSPSR